MKAPKHLLSILLATSIVSTTFGAGYMKFDGVDGEATRKTAAKQVEILSVTGLSETATRDAASGLPTGKRQHKPFTITKPVDKATPQLAKGASFPSPVILSSNGVRYQLEGVKVVSVTRQGEVETVTLTCTSARALSADKASTATRATPATPAARAAPAQDHNSSRSNKTSS